MNEPQVLYEATLATAGRKLTHGGLAVMVLWVAVGSVLCFGFTSFPGSLVPLAFFVLGGIVFSFQIRRVV